MQTEDNLERRRKTEKGKAYGEGETLKVRGKGVRWMRCVQILNDKVCGRV